MTFLSPGELSDRLLWRKQAQELWQTWDQDFIEAPTEDYLKSSINLLIIFTINHLVNNFLEPKDFSFTLRNYG